MKYLIALVIIAGLWWVSYDPQEAYSHCLLRHSPSTCHTILE